MSHAAQAAFQRMLAQRDLRSVAAGPAGGLEFTTNGIQKATPHSPGASCQEGDEQTERAWYPRRRLEGEVDRG
jgi:hypothetical protein